MPAHAQTSTDAIVAAGRHLLEERGMDALTMRDVASAVGVRAPSLYKRVRDRTDLVRLILEDAADELTSALDAAASSGDPVADARAMVLAFRKFARANPVTYTLMFAPQAGAPGATARSVRSSATFLRIIAELVGPERALPAARTIVAWAHGFITMELAGAFRLGGDVDQAWDFGLDRILAALRCSLPAKRSRYLSSAFVPAATMAAGLRPIAANQPFTPVIETMRGLWMGHTSTGAATGHEALLAAAYCAAILAAAAAAASWLFRHRTAGR